MFEAKLFIGFPIDPDLLRSLSEANEYARNTFVNNQSEYLHETVRDDIRYIGKFVDCIQIEDSLPMLKENLFSLVRRVIPDFEAAAHPLFVFPAPIASCETLQTAAPQTSSK